MFLDTGLRRYDEGIVVKAEITSTVLAAQAAIQDMEKKKHCHCGAGRNPGNVKEKNIVIAAQAAIQKRMSGDGSGKTAVCLFISE